MGDEIFESDEDKFFTRTLSVSTTSIRIPFFVYDQFKKMTGKINNLSGWKVLINLLEKERGRGEIFNN